MGGIATMKLSSKYLALAFVGATALTAVGIAKAAMVEPRDVKIDDMMIASSLTGQPGDPGKGADAFKGRKLGNCLACHVNSAMANEQWHGEVGPPLDGVAERYSEAELRAILVDSKAVFGEQTIMPAFYKIISDDESKRVQEKFEGKTILEAQQVEDIIAYLKTLN